MSKKRGETSKIVTGTVRHLCVYRETGSLRKAHHRAALYGTLSDNDLFTCESNSIQITLNKQGFV